MARFLFAWELGGGSGHAVRLAQIARPLQARGHELHFALRDLSLVREALGPLADAPQVHLWQAPLWLPALQGLPPAASFAELLFLAGYLDGTRLAGPVRGWRSLIDALRPDLLVVDHAPTALLASRGMSLRRALVDTGFFLPPAATPMPGFREWEPADRARLARTESLALAACNAALQAQGIAPMQALHELLDVDEAFMLTWPELDHYAAGAQGRDGIRYWGPLPADDAGAAAVWPGAGAGAGGDRLFAYLKGDYPAIDALLHALSQAPYPTLAHVSGLTPAQRSRYTGSRLRFSDGAVAMGDALRQATAVLCHAGSGTVNAALQAGLPLLMLPMQAEQLLLARRVVRCGAGALLMPSGLAAGLLPALADVVGSASMRERAGAIAASHPPGSEAAVADRVATRLESLAAGQIGRAAGPPAVPGPPARSDTANRGGADRRDI